MEIRKTAACLGLALALTLCLPAAQAAEDNTAFTDVPAGSWFEQGVKTCAERGVMVGTGEGTFSPEATLTEAECLTLALRLYDLQRGGDGSFLTAPEEAGKLSLTLADGSVIEGYNCFHWWEYRTAAAWGPYVLCPGETPEEKQAWGKAREGDAVFTVEGVDYPGSTWCWDPTDYVLMFQPSSTANGEKDILHDAVYSNIPGPDRWWRDAMYTAHRWGLRDYEATPGFRYLMDSFLDEGRPASREEFARALAEAAGDVERLYNVDWLPDVKRGERYEGIFKLYEAGILSGVDAPGTFNARGQLTRAEAAVMAARVLDPGQRLGKPPETVSAYERAVMELRNTDTYCNERTVESPYATIFIFDWGAYEGVPTGVMRLIGKEGFGPGEGTVTELPCPPNMTYAPADTTSLSEDGRTFTYTYTFAEPLTFNGIVQRAAGTYTYTVDLVSGQVTVDEPPMPVVTYASSMAELTGEGFTVEKTLDAPAATAVLGYTLNDAGERSYTLTLVSKGGEDDPEGFRYEVWLSDGEREADRAPDQLFLTKDRQTLIFTYKDDGDFYLSRSNAVAMDRKGSFRYGPDILDRAIQGTTVEKTVENEEFKAVLVYDEPHGVRDYALYVLEKKGGAVYAALLPSTQVMELEDGSVYAPTTVAPNTLYFRIGDLTYHYRFEEKLVENGVEYHDEGIYTYFFAPYGNIAIRHPGSSYEEALKWEYLSEEDIILDSGECAVFMHTETSQHRPPVTLLSLLFKPGSQVGEGVCIDLPTVSRYHPEKNEGYMTRVLPPDAIGPGEDGNTLVYSYYLERPVVTSVYNAATKKQEDQVVREAGTYTFTVDLTTGEWTSTHTPL